MQLIESAGVQSTNYWMGTVITHKAFGERAEEAIRAEAILINDGLRVYATRGMKGCIQILEGVKITFLD